MDKLPQGGYKNFYNEMKIIGRGNFGSATLVSPIAEPDKFFIAKKIFLGNLAEKEQMASLLEAKLLKDLKHPNIVEYIDSYIEDGQFIIIMEYCEEGDLAHHIKMMRQKKQNFSEELILNWFLQILFALGYVHSKRILHRDIKTSNIFLNSNGTVKLGDFGISKILEGTLEKAETMVGTPYYMSYKSDVWALGCVLYELCTLKHAFTANNLLGLVYKIVQEKQEPIPKIYSNNLQNLLNQLLTKKYTIRPTIQDILNMEFMKEIAMKFVNARGDIHRVNKIKKTALHRDLEDTEQFKGLTPSQILKEKKIIKAKNRERELAEAARSNMVNHSHIKTKKLLNNMSSMDRTKYTQLDKSREFYGGGTIESKQMELSRGKGEHTQYNDYPTQTIASINMNTQYVSQVPNHDDIPVGARNPNFDFSKAGERTIMGDTIMSNNVTSYPQQSFQQTLQTNQFDTMKTDLHYNDFDDGFNNENEVYDDDFEELPEYYTSEEEDGPSRLTNPAGKKEMEEVLGEYKEFLNHPNEVKKGLSVISEQPIENSGATGLSNSYREERKIATSGDDKIARMKDTCVNSLGDVIFDEVYKYLSHHRKKGTSDDKILRHLKEKYGKEKLQHCFLVDQYILVQEMYGK